LKRFNRATQVQKAGALLFVMMKPFARKVFGIFGLQVHRLHPPTDCSGPLRFGRFVVETNNAELIRSYRNYPENNTVITRLVTLISRKGPIAMIDIGANCGDSLAIAKAASPDSEVLCVEGDESMLSDLARNAQQFTGVEIKGGYLGESTGHVSVSIQKRGYNNTLASSEGGEVISIERLDKMVLSWTGLPRLRFIKCDTEGYDIAVLFGARETLRTFQPIVLFEYNREAMQTVGEGGSRIFSFLAELGYHDVLFYDNLGRFLLATDLLQENLLRDLHDYADGRAGQIYYYDIIAFANKDAELVADFLREERLRRSVHSTLLRLQPGNNSHTA
jgi:FkbM family methyltransferase